MARTSLAAAPPGAIDWRRHPRLPSAVLSAAAASLERCVRALVGDSTAQVTRWTAEAVAHTIGAATTGSLTRVRGEATTAAGRRPWSLFLKEVHTFRRWPLYDHVVDHVPADLLVEDAWRDEARVYTDGRVAAILPEGLRLPRCFDAVALDDESVLLVLEDVDAMDGGWDRPRYRRAARLLGRLDAALTRHRALPGAERRPRNVRVQAMYLSRLRPVALPALLADELWVHPLLGDHGDQALRDDLAALAERLPAVVAALEDVPQVLGHGDASPENLLVPREAPDTFVVIDWAMGAWGAVGDDLGQLLVGGAHTGALPAEALVLRRADVLDAYQRGLDEEGCDVDPDAVRLGLDAGLVVRSAFTALPLERLGDPLDDELAQLFQRRLELTRVLVDIGLALPLRRRTGSRG